MSKLAEAIHALCVTAWAGGLWTVGLLVLPLLFVTALDHGAQIAIQGRLLLWVAMLGTVCGAYLLLFRLFRFGGHALRQAFFWLVLGMVLLDIGQQFFAHRLLQLLEAHSAVHHWVEIGLRDRGATWSGLPSVVYLLQCVLAVPLVLLQQSVAR